MQGDNAVPRFTVLKLRLPQVERPARLFELLELERRSWSAYKTQSVTLTFNTQSPADTTVVAALAQSSRISLVLKPLPDVIYPMSRRR